MTSSNGRNYWGRITIRGRLHRELGEPSFYGIALFERSVILIPNMPGSRIHRYSDRPDGILIRVPPTVYQLMRPQGKGIIRPVHTVEHVNVIPHVAKCYVMRNALLLYFDRLHTVDQCWGHPLIETVTGQR